MFILILSALFYFSLSFFTLLFLKTLSNRRWAERKGGKALNCSESRLMPVPALLPAILTPVLLISSVIALTEERFGFESQLSLYVFLLVVLVGVLFLLVTTKAGRQKW